METILSLIVVLIVIGIIFYLVVEYVIPALPFPDPLRRAIVALIALAVILYLVVRYLPLAHIS